MRRRHLLAIGLGVYALALVATAPASFVDAGLQGASDGRLRLAEAQGTLWSGTGQFEVREAAGRTGVGRNVAWRFQPPALLRGRLGFDIDIGQSGKRFPLTLSPRRVEISGAELALPAALLGVAVPRLAALRPTGDLLVHVAQLAYAAGEISGNATVEWRSAGSLLTTVSPLGDYELRVEGRAGIMNASLRTLRGPLQLDGKGSREYGGQPAFHVTARVDPEHARQLAPLLRLIAIERGQGNFELQLGQNAGQVSKIAAGPHYVRQRTE